MSYSPYSHAPDPRYMPDPRFAGYDPRYPDTRHRSRPVGAPYQPPVDGSVQQRAVDFAWHSMIDRGRQEVAASKVRETEDRAPSTTPRVDSSAQAPSGWGSDRVPPKSAAEGRATFKRLVDEGRHVEAFIYSGWLFK